MLITDEVINFFFICKLKAQYKYSNRKYTDLAFYFHYKLHEKNSQKNFELFLAKNEFKILNNLILPSNTTYAYFVRNFELKNNHIKLKYPYIEIDKHSQLIPIYTTFESKISNTYRSTCSLKSQLLSTNLNQEIQYYKIILNDGTLKKFKINETLQLENLITQLKDKNEIIKIKSCSICEYKTLCHSILVKHNDLRLIGNISESSAKKWNEKGIFTIHQLSYFYKPRKKTLITSTKSRYKYELKALSIRENKIYFTGDISLNYENKEIYIDFESLPDEDYVYLISAVIVSSSKTIKSYSYWANDIKEEETIFQNLFSLLEKYKNAKIYHYGNFEIKKLIKFNSKHLGTYSNFIDNIKKRNCNLLEFFYEDVFLPTYTNSLKDMCKYIGYSWSNKSASAIQSIIWRKQWECSFSNKIKKKLITYNIEDCVALHKLKYFLYNLQQNKIESSNLYNLFKNSGYKFGNTNFKIESFQKINETAYFDYQRTKIYIKDHTFKKEVNTKNSFMRKHHYSKPNKIVKDSIPKNCKYCLNEKLYIHEKNIRTITDLISIKGGMKKLFIEYHHYRFRCSECKKVFTNSVYKESKYGKTLKDWIIYLLMTYKISYSEIVNMLNMCFEILMKRQTLTSIKNEYALILKNKYNENFKNILCGSLIHIDETTVTINKRKHYVWVLTNMTQVIYLFRENRTTNFLVQLLDNFKGILISDFYTGYDSLKVIHQKCLVHLIRDINDLIFKNQENNELIFISKLFGDLLNQIIKTIDKFGLKKYHLKKHKKDVTRFYDKLDKSELETIISIKLKKRLIRNKNILFTFLDYDNIPWNNNNVEHAIKEFAKYRRNTDGLYSKNSLQEYLILLSIYQTCKYQNINFFNYLNTTT